RSINEAGGELLESANAFDEYRGSQVPAGHKSVAFSMTFRSAERTLTDVEVEARLEAIRAALRQGHQARVREWRHACIRHARLGPWESHSRFATSLTTCSPL